MIGILVYFLGVMTMIVLCAFYVWRTKEEVTLGNVIEMLVLTMLSWLAVVMLCMGLIWVWFAQYGDKVIFKVKNKDEHEDLV